MSKMQFRLEGERPGKPWLYAVSGLPNVYLLNGYKLIRRDDEEYVSVTDVDGLHRAIARHLVLRRKALTPAEVRFIRKALDMRQADLAVKLGVSSQAVARWEKGQCEMPSTAEKLLRAVFLANNLKQDDDLKVLRTLLISVLDDLDQEDDMDLRQASFRLDETWTESELVAA